MAQTRAQALIAQGRSILQAIPSKLESWRQYRVLQANKIDSRLPADVRAEEHGKIDAEIRERAVQELLEAVVKFKGAMEAAQDAQRAAHREPVAAVKSEDLTKWEGHFRSEILLAPVLPTGGTDVLGVVERLRATYGDLDASIPKPADAVTEAYKWRMTDATLRLALKNVALQTVVDMGKDPHAVHYTRARELFQVFQRDEEAALGDGYRQALADYAAAEATESETREACGLVSSELGIPYMRLIAQVIEGRNVGTETNLEMIMGGRPGDPFDPSKAAALGGGVRRVGEPVVAPAQ